MTNEKRATQVANNLIQVFRLAVPTDEAGEIDVLQHHASRLSPSDRQYHLNKECLAAVEKSLEKFVAASGTYPAEKSRERLIDIAITVKDRGTPVAEAHAALTEEIVAFLKELAVRGEWEVVHAIRGVHSEPELFRVSNVEFFRLDEQKFFRLGQRYETGLLAPAEDTAVSHTWFHQEGMLCGQVVAVARVRAVDAEHAREEAHARINEAMDLLRYGQLSLPGPPWTPVPEFGLSPIAVPGCCQHQSICFRIDQRDAMTSKSAGGADGAMINYCKLAPGFSEIEGVLRIDTESRNEMQRRIVAGLSWVGQASFAGSNSVRLVALVTALEAMLIGESESLGKRVKLASRIAALPKSSVVVRVAEADVDKLYRERSACLHAGKMSVGEDCIRFAVSVVGHAFAGLLQDNQLRECDDLQGVLQHLCPEVLESPEN